MTIARMSSSGRVEKGQLERNEGYAIESELDDSNDTRRCVVGEVGPRGQAFSVES